MSSDTFKVTLSARIEQDYKQTFTLKKSDLYAWMKTYGGYDPYDEDNDWEEIVSDFAEGFWEDLTNYPTGLHYYSSHEGIEIEDGVDLTLKQPHEVQLHQEAKLF